MRSVCRFWFPVLFLTFSLPGAFAGEECRHDRETFRCVSFVKNYDADTITVNIPGVHPLIGENISVRVEGIDAPEVKTHDSCEKNAARIARNLVSSVLRSSKRIDLTGVKKDKYFRLLATVVVDGRSLKDVLLKNRLAYEYDGGTKRKVNWCGVGGGLRLPASP